LDLSSRFATLPDPRDASRTLYSVPMLMWEELSMLLSGVDSRYAMIDDCRTAGFARSLRRLVDSKAPLSAAPHPDTVYKYLQRLPPEALQMLLARLSRDLLRRRCFEATRFDGEYLVGIDATWLHSYKKRHCEQCLVRKHSTGEVYYSHAVLEAKVLLGRDMALPLASVPIQNDDPNATKQDCEQKAFVRLAETLRNHFPRLPMCLLLDSLYGVAPVLEQCEDMNASYIIVFKKGRTPAFYEEARRRADRGEEARVDQPDGTVQFLSWATNLDYRGHTVHAVFCRERKPRNANESTWAWITDHRPTRRTVQPIANRGRCRWNIEETYNALKTGPTRQHHDFGSQGFAWYNTWLVAQLALLLLHLVARTDLLRPLSRGAFACFRDAFRTLKTFARRLRESLQRDAERGTEPLGRLRLRFLFDTS